jgi:outer membrane receptor protein involved in Fe transport
MSTIRFVIHIAIFVLIAFIAVDSMAQKPGGGNRDFSSMPAEGIVTGKILDRSLDTPMEYANLVLYSMHDSSIVAGTVTNEDGTFRMEEVRYGRFYAIANFIGYNKTFINDIRISPKQKIVKLADIYLEPASTNLQGIEVVADRDHVEYKIDKKIVNVSQDILGAGGSAVSVLENIPSVQVDIEGNVSLRGTENFQVLVDGRPSVIQGSDALQQIPASTIDQIEIITNPSAKYDPDGVGGIINVILKKQKQPGINGVVNASIGSGNKYSTDFLLNYRAKHVNVFGGLDLNYREWQMKGNSEYETYLEDTIKYRNSEIKGKMNRRGYGIRAGLDYYLTDKTTLTLQGRYGYYGFGRDFTSTRYIFTEPLTTDDYSRSSSTSDRGGNYYRINLDFLHNFDNKGQKLEAMVYYSNRKTDDWDEQKDYITDENWNIIDDTPETIKSIGDEVDYELRLKADYTKPVGAEGRLEAGYQSRLNTENEVYTFFDYDHGTGDWIKNDQFSSVVDFKRNIHAVYGIYSNVWGTFGYQLGLRGEYTDRKFENSESKEAHIIDRFDYFPSVHLSKSFTGEHQVIVSYSRRIDRPRGRELDPFPNYMDPYNIRIGNPTLEPEYIDSYELGYQKRFFSGCRINGQS